MTFAIFCAIGRPHYRGSERFPVDEPMTIEVDNDSYQVRVCDISETGISFSSNLPLYLPKTKEITLHLQSRDYRARSKGHVVRVVVGEKCWRYGVQFTEVNPADIREFYQYIYDRINHNLPTHKDSWMTTWDDLLENFNRRFQSNERPVSACDQIALPKVRLNEDVEYNGTRR
ncbi:glycosyltransferases (cellulose synthase) [Streptococcus infantarius subsp. infantarius CJ18]|uniref:PilZ domain-containing protein n=1 Tax=uncultured Streptococcus sp. TaxID=83427 RepID=UPI00024DD17E|nr:PilZ domain-containing protein [uncultured Streptococcus sp.]AEZ61705.1 glycosyltransferases (cellulose synthase) [Streptococcus infantarius subsp. infantarius CJ18]MCO4685312.1 glycosyltransferases (cellulose synthase) [Streptococcus infantarius subsp. infantarius]MCO4691099.1 glycosyltransferases (cellulose synthase) [Streptococcus infantarius subsp. infantarius]